MGVTLCVNMSEFNAYCASYARECGWGFEWHQEYKSQEPYTELRALPLARFTRYDSAQYGILIDDEAITLVSIELQEVSISVRAGSLAIARSKCNEIAALVPAWKDPDEGFINVGFWSLSRNGASRRWRTLSTADASQIPVNYTPAVGFASEPRKPGDIWGSLMTFEAGTLTPELLRRDKPSTAIALQTKCCGNLSAALFPRINLRCDNVLCGHVANSSVAIDVPGGTNTGASARKAWLGSGDSNSYGAYTPAILEIAASAISPDPGLSAWSDGLWPWNLRPSDLLKLPMTLAELYEKAGEARIRTSKAEVRKLGFVA